MNNQIISQIRDLLSPAALAYLNDLVAGRAPLETGTGIGATPSGLTAAQARVVRSIVQAQDNTDLSASSIINSGILRTRGGLESDNIPQSEQELYDRLYNITTGESLGALGPKPVAVGTGAVGGGSSSANDIPPRPGDNYPDILPPADGSAMPVVSPAIGATLSLFNQQFQRFYRTGGGGLNEADRKIIMDALRDPNSPDFTALAKFSATTTDPSRFAARAEQIIQQQGLLPAEDFGLGEVREDVQFAEDISVFEDYNYNRRLRPYYDPVQSTIIYISKAEAERRGLADVELDEDKVDQYVKNWDVVSQQITPAPKPGQYAGAAGVTGVSGATGTRPSTDPDYSAYADAAGVAGAASAPARATSPFFMAAGVAGIPGDTNLRYTAPQQPQQATQAEPTAIPVGLNAVFALLREGITGIVDEEAVMEYYGDNPPDDPTVQTDGSVTGGGVTGGSVSGGLGSGVQAPTALDQAIPEDWRDAAREAYPGYYAIVRNIPEIAELLEDAIANTFTEQEFQARLEQTNWWKQTTASAREWDINGERDPASQQTQIDNRVALIRQVALDSFGVRLGADSLNELANDSLRLGWTQQFLLNAIGDVATQSSAGVSQLRAGYVGQQLRQTANDYGIAISDNTFNKFVNQIAVGQETQDSFQQYALTQAKNLFPSVSDRLDAGETFQQIVDPYREQTARLLEIDPDEIDFTQSEYVKALTYQDERGEQRPMSFTEFGDYIRQTRSFGYEYTDQARNKAYQVANDLANLFGKA